MTRRNALEQYRKEAEPLLEKGKAEFYQELQGKTEELSEKLREVIRELTENSILLEKEKIMFLHFSLLRISLEKETYEILAQAMDARWYADPEPAEATFSLDFLFPMWKGIREKLTEESRKYRGKLNRYDTEHMLSEAVMECNSMLAQALRFMFRDIEENPDFMKLEKEDTWGIYWGEYRDQTELIACVNREEKTQLDWERALRQTKNEESSMVFGFWYRAELKDSDCRGKLLYFVRFEDCTLENLCFDDAILTGARFTRCRIKKCSFRNAIIRQADFSECTWEENCFDGADMTQAVFAEAELPFIHLEAAQLQTILIDRRRQE